MCCRPVLAIAAARTTKLSPWSFDLMSALGFILHTHLDSCFTTIPTIAMAASSRTAMRILSPRFQCLRHPPPSPIIRQARCISSRYTTPAKRGYAAAQSQPSSFLDTSLESDASRTPPSPVRDARQEEEGRRQYHLNRMRFAGMGLILSFGTLGLIVYSLDLDDMEQSEKKRRQSGQQLDASSEAIAEFQGKEVHVIGAGEGKRIVAQGQGEEIELVETGTSSVPHFPRTIYLPTSSDSNPAAPPAQPNSPTNPGNISNQEEYTLVGLGIRTVMWIQVYVVGLYIRTQDIGALQSKLIHHVNPIASTLVPSEKEDLKKKLLEPVESREIWTDVLRQTPGIKTAWRVSPTRNTDFGHLRDGFVTGITKRTQEAKQLAPDTAAEYDGEEFGRAVQTFKSVFAAGKAPKGSILLMCRDDAGALDMLYQAKPDGAKSGLEKLGSVPDERISRLIWLGYLGGEKVSSEAARKGVVEGCAEFAGRPIGSAETRIV